MTEYYDGPSGSIAGFERSAHLYWSEWDHSADDYAPTFRLSPVSPDLLALALEARAIEGRWWTAFYGGRATQEMRPAPPADRSRHNQLDAALKRRLEIDPRNYIRSGARSGRSTAGTGGVSCQPKVSGALLDGG